MSTEQTPNPPAFPVGAKLIEGKSPERVHKCYIKYLGDWQAQYDMLLMDGKTCSDCVHTNRCVLMFDSKSTDKSCQFHPSRFQGQIQTKS